VLWRHGQTAWNVERRFQGHSDIALDEVGRAQAIRGAEQLVGLAPTVVVASDLVRARDTATELANRLGQQVRVDPALRETSGGRWEGKRDIELAEDPDYRAWSAGADVQAGGAETRTQVAERSAAAVQRLLAELDGGQLAVMVTHGGTIRSILGRLLDLPVDQWRVFGGLANCCWSILEEGRTGWRLTEHNAHSLPLLVLGDDE
jgi:glucosyl-3-phosphoglycerate phosphatase